VTLVEVHPLLSPKKAFGQNFLVQRSAIDTILREALASPALGLLEIGPGPGTLTEGLLVDGRPVWAMDLDPEAITLLAARFGGLSHFHLLQGDAVRAALPEGDSWSVVGNLPYNAATPILTRFLLEPIPWERLVFMFQLEVGQKILGRPGTKEFGPLSVLSQLCCRVTRLMKLGPGAFRPSPKVDSVVLRFDPHPDAPDYATRTTLLDLLHRSFAHRRKTLANNWQGFVDAGTTLEILKSLKLPSQVRAEAVPVETWRELLKRVQDLERGKIATEVSG
jgi:16S rRNA (adenine1518-N6/adenine1519-N6)-dimethyltransferase